MIFPITQKVTNPPVIVKVKTAREDTFVVIEREDICFRVIPTCAREVLALQMLEHGAEKFAPAIGHGVIITRQAHAKLNAAPAF